MIRETANLFATVFVACFVVTVSNAPLLFLNGATPSIPFHILYFILFACLRSQNAEGDKVIGFLAPWRVNGQYF